VGKLIDRSKPRLHGISVAAIFRMDGSGAVRRKGVRRAAWFSVMPIAGEIAVTQGSA
jgi:hypothetical protein